MSVKSVNLSAHFEQFIDGKIDSGEYTNASEVVRDALRLLEEKSLTIAELRREIEVGESSGFSEKSPFEAVNKELDQA